MNRERITKHLGDGLSKARFAHCLGVENTARELARIYGVDAETAALAGLIHDCAKSLTYERMVNVAQKHIGDLDALEMGSGALLHAPVGAYLASATYGVTDAGIISAIRYHTTGRADMTTLEKIIYIADYIEPNRADVGGIGEVRLAAQTDIDWALCLAIRGSISHVNSRGRTLHPRSLKAEAWISDILRRQQP